jgi:nicotinamidase-related amidase
MTAPALDPLETALVVYHMTDIRTRPDHPGYDQPIVDALPVVARLLARCRAAGVLPVYLVPERDIAEGSEIIPELAPLPGEIVIQHVGGGAFATPEFAPLLRQRGRDTILIIGNAVDRGLNDTARQARYSGVRPVMVRGACFTQDITESPVGPVSRWDIERVHLAALHRHGIAVMDVDAVIAALA